MVTKNITLAVAALFLVFETKSAFGVIDELKNNSNSNVVDSIKDKVLKESNRTGRSLHKDCANGALNFKCMKIHMLSFLEDLSSRDELRLLPGLSIVKENITDNKTSAEQVAAELSRQFPGKPDEKINRYLLFRLQDYLNRHSLRYRLIDPETTEKAMGLAKGDTASIETERSKKHGGKGGVMAAAMMMKGALAAAAMAALAGLAGKALMTALISLLLSALAAMKGHHGGGGKTTYEIIAKPEVSHHHSHSHEEHHEHEHGHNGGYRRAYENAYQNNYVPPYESAYSSPQS